MARLIDADEFERFLMNLPDEVLCEDCCYVVVNEMRKQPTIDTVKHGKWIEDKERDMLRCSVCQNFYVENYMFWFKYCPECGARMDGE